MTQGIIKLDYQIARSIFLYNAIHHIHQVILRDKIHPSVLPVFHCLPHFAQFLVFTSPPEFFHKFCL
jgi:hypothetical protein